MFYSTSASSGSPRKILPTDCSAKQTWPSCRARPLVMIAPSGSATRPASTSSKKVSIGCKISAERWVAVIRTDSIERALGAANAVIAGGFRVIEITYSFNGATEAIAKLSDANENDLLIGAGTILNRGQVREAVGAGARFLVSPCVLPEVIDAARELQVAIIPGAFTPTEIYTAYSLGADIVKIF